MAVNHYSADSAPRSRPSLHPRSSHQAGIRVESTGFPLLISELKASVVMPVYMLADDASAYIRYGDCGRRLAERTAFPTAPSLTGTSPIKTSLD